MNLDLVMILRYVMKSMRNKKEPQGTRIHIIINVRILHNHYMKYI